MSASRDIVGRDRNGSTGIVIHQPADFDHLRAAGRLASATLDMIGAHVRPGVTTGELDRLCQDFVESHGGISATIGYRGYQHASCISVNHVVCHGIPGERRLADGDILNIDISVIVDGWFGDTSRTFIAGRANRRASLLVEVAYEAMLRGIASVRAGATLGDLGHAIQSFVENRGMSVVREFAGHGIGRRLHEAPSVLHFGVPGEGVPLRPGMVFTVEPMVNAGGPEVKVLADGWTAVTRDRSLSAQFEHTVIVSDGGCEIITPWEVDYLRR